jgi:hypothetical protein
MGLKDRRSNPGGEEIFIPSPTGPEVHPPSCTMDTGSLLGVQQLKHDINHAPTSSAEVKERVEVYLYSPTGLPWPLIRRNLLMPIFKRDPRCIEYKIKI